MQMHLTVEDNGQKCARHCQALLLQACFAGYDSMLTCSRVNGCALMSLQAGYVPDLTGFHAKRLEFEPEYDAEAEALLADLEFRCDPN